MAIRRFRGIESGIGRHVKAADLLAFLDNYPGQHCPKDCPTQPEGPGGQPAPSGAASRLGTALDIQQAARLLGCSPWSVRNTWIPRGLPHLRSGASGKLIFFEAQIVRWIERKQQEDK